MEEVSWGGLCQCCRLYWGVRGALYWGPWAESSSGSRGRPQPRCCQPWDRSGPCVRASARSRGPPPAWAGGSSWLGFGPGPAAAFSAGLERGAGFQEAPGPVQLLPGTGGKGAGKGERGPLSRGCAAPGLMLLAWGSPGVGPHLPCPGLMFGVPMAPGLGAALCQGLCWHRGPWGPYPPATVGCWEAGGCSRFGVPGAGLIRSQAGGVRGGVC